MKLVIILLLTLNVLYAKTDKPEVDLAIRTLQKELLPAQKTKEYLDEILKLKKKHPQYLPLEIEYIYALTENYYGEIAEDIYKTRFKKNKSKTDEFLYLFSQVASWRTPPPLQAEVYKKVEKLFDSKNKKSDLNYNSRITILKRSRNLEQRKSAAAYLQKNFPNDPLFKRLHPRLLAATGELDQLITGCQEEILTLNDDLANCKGILRAQVEKTQFQRDNIKKLIDSADFKLQKAKEKNFSFFNEFYRICEELEEKEMLEKIAQKLISFQSDWVPSPSLKKHFNLKNYKEYLLFQNLSEAISTPDVKTKISLLKEQIDAVEDNKELTSYTYQNLLSAYLHPTIKNDREAIDVLEEWLEIDKDNNYAKLRLAELYLKLDKKLEKALELTNEVISFHDERMSEYKKYYPSYTEFLEYSDITLAENYKQKGKILRKMDKYELATVALKRSFSLVPINETAYLLYESYKELDLERDQVQWGLIALVDAKEKLPKEDTSKLSKELVAFLSKQTGLSPKDINLENLAAKKSSLYNLAGEKKEEGPKHPLIGKSLIPLPYNTLDKRPFKWESLKGKNVLLSFWATWCVPCIQELTVLDKLKREYKGKPFEIVAICTDGITKKKDMKKILKKAKIKNLQILEGKSDSMDIYGFNSIPTSFYINPKGMIIDKGQGYSENLEEEIKKKLNL